MESELQGNSGGYIILSANGVKTVNIPIGSADEASATWWRFVRENTLGASDLKTDSGMIYSNNNEFIARVSYNGRVWTPNGELLQDFANRLRTNTAIGPEHWPLQSRANTKPSTVNGLWVP